jgi:hypothetical protein
MTWITTSEQPYDPTLNRERLLRQIAEKAIELNLRVLGLGAEAAAERSTVGGTLTAAAETPGFTDRDSTFGPTGAVTAAASIPGSEDRS